MALGGSTYLKNATMLEQLLEEINFQRTKEMRQLLKDDCGFVVLQGTTYWTDLFVRHFLFQEEKAQAIDCDDLLFFVRKRHVKGSSRHLPKYETDVEVFRKDSKKLPIGDPEIDWEETVYLNLIVHQFDYTLTLAICTRTSPKELQVLKRHSQKVYASPSRRKMDTKGEGEEMTYPHICFMVDNFDEIQYKSVSLCAQAHIMSGVLRHRGPRRGDGVRGAGGARAGVRRAGRHLPRVHPVRHAHQGLRLQANVAVDEGGAAHVVRPAGRRGGGRGGGGAVRVRADEGPRGQGARRDGGVAAARLRPRHARLRARRRHVGRVGRGPRRGVHVQAPAAAERPERQPVALRARRGRVALQGGRGQGALRGRGARLALRRARRGRGRRPQGRAGRRRVQPAVGDARLLADVPPVEGGAARAEHAAQRVPHVRDAALVGDRQRYPGPPRGAYPHVLTPRRAAAARTDLASRRRRGPTTYYPYN